VRFKAVPEDVQAPAIVVTEMYRMFQEILSNIEKHSQARCVDMEIRQDGDTLLLRVSDNGKGFFPDQLQSSDALGLLELRERTAALDGEMEIQGAPAKGTTIILRVPIPPPSPQLVEGVEKGGS
jgi:signal transduction histidine kinase